MLTLSYKAMPHLPIRDFTGAPYMVHFHSTGLILLHPDNVPILQINATRQGYILVEVKGDQDAEQATQAV